MAVSEVAISAKDLGAVALAEFCPRCFWLKYKVGNKLPFQIFPGIFRPIDSYNKKVVHGYLDRHGAAPATIRQRELPGLCPIGWPGGAAE
ncbi:MAG: hypothetical protein D8M54_19445 [Chloroflexi bacterium]|nr:hypothetical protein [Chloroflexota bacterium]